MSTPRISFEFFPPKSLSGSFRLWDAVKALAPLAPEFVSVTYGAGGTTRALTHEAVTAIGAETGLRVAAHLTCVEASKEETLEIARTYARAGVTDIVALRGDATEGGDFRAHPDGFENAVELIAGLKDAGDFTIRVGAYPEGHPDSASMKQNIDWLKRKIDAGADGAITQFFFEADTYFRFRDACADAGIDVPIVPGVLPIGSWDGLQRFAKRCGATLPTWLCDAYEKAARDDRTDLLSIAITTELCAELIDGGVQALHFYTLNRPELTRDTCRALGIEPKLTLEKVA